MKLHLVTGGEGFIGGAIVSEVNGRPFDVKSGFDILDQEQLLREVRTAHGIFHCAAKLSVPESFLLEEEYYRTNVEGTRCVIDAAKHVGCKIVFSSSAAIYGEADKRVSETHPLSPGSPYAKNKYDGEELLRASGIPSVALRYFNVYGPRQSEEYAGVIKIFIMKALRGEGIVIHGDGTQVRDFVFVDDVARANSAAMNYEHSSFEIFNIGSGTETSIRTVAETIIQLTQSTSKIIYTPSRIGDIRYSQADVSRAKKLLGWEAQVPLEEGLRKTIEYYRVI